MGEQPGGGRPHQDEPAPQQPVSERSASVRRTHPDHVPRQAQDDEGKEQCVDVPAQQQRDARPEQQLPEAAFLHEDHHAVEDQHHSEEVRPHFGGDHLVEIQPVGRREGEKRGRERNPPVGREPAKGQVGQRRGRDEEQQHQHLCCVDLCPQVILERHHGQLDQGIAADGKAVERLVGRCSVGVEGLMEEPQEVVFGREVRGHRQVCERHAGVRSVSPEEVAPVVGGQEHRRQGRQQQQ